MHDKAVRALTQAVDDGLRSEDELLAKTRAQLAATPGKVQEKYAELKGQAEQQSSTEQETVPATRVHRGIWDSITHFVSDLHERAKKWFADVFGQALGGLLLGILEGLIIVGIGLLVGWAVGAIVGAFIAAAEVAAIVTAVVLVIAAAGFGIYNRFQEFAADNPGEKVGFWRGLGLVGLGIADLTGIPFIVEGLVGQRAFGAKMSRFDANERLGMGLVFFGAAIVSVRSLLRAKPKIDGQGREGKPASDGAPRTLPQGLTEAQFEAASKIVRAGAGHLGDDIVVQGSRAAGTARPDSDIDFAVRVSPERFNELIQERFGSPNAGSAKERTMQRAIETGKIQAGEAGVSGVRRALEAELGMDVDLSVIRQGGPFDTPPFIQVP
jgi:hypothetical protein